MASIELAFDWIQLSESQQLRQWRSFLTSLDAGDAGYHLFYAELMPRWDRGDVPELVVEARYSVEQAEMAAEAIWDAVHGFTTDGVNAIYGDPPF